MITVSAQELKDLLERFPGMVLLNVRPIGTLLESQLPGSVRVPQVELEAKADALLPDKTVVIAVYGADLNCEASSKAATTLEKLGYKYIYNFMVGLKGWKEAGFGVSVELGL
jgi:rhodanese-related sulfurtransferase